MPSHDDEPVAARLGRALRSLRLDLGVSAAEVARRIDETTNNVSRWETGQRTADPAVLNRIEDALEVERGTVLKMAGFVSTGTETLQVLASDPLLDEVTRPFVVSAYTTAVQMARRNGRGEKHKPSPRRRSRA
jgi:transcriptional regulator with XRE-family HTH domain